MNRPRNIFGTVSIFISCLLVFFVFSSSSILAGQETSTIETNPEGVKTILPPETVLASLGEQTITLGEFNQIWEQIPEEYKLQLDKSVVLDQIISEKLLIQEAKIIGLEKDNDVLEQIKKMTEQILVQTLIQREILDKVAVNDEEISQYYEQNKDSFNEKEQVHLFNISTEKEEEAQAILEQLKAGGDFGGIAKEKSTGPSAVQSGDLGFVTKGTLVPEIEAVIFSLEIEGLSEIIKTDSGFNIFKVTEKKPEIMKTLEDVKEDIIQTLLPTKQKAAFDNLLVELKGKTAIVINTEALK